MATQPQGRSGTEKGTADQEMNPNQPQVNPPGTAGSPAGSTPMAKPKEGAPQPGRHDNQSVGNLLTGFPYMPGDGSPEAKLSVSGIEAIERYGVQGKPIPASEAWVAPINNFSKKDVRAEKWVLINYPAKSVTFANTFDGMLGANFKQDVATFPLDPKRVRGQIEGHVKVDVNDCPVAIPVEDAEKAGISPPLRDETRQPVRSV